MAITVSEEVRKRVIETIKKDPRYEKALSHMINAVSLNKAFEITWDELVKSGDVMTKEEHRWWTTTIFRELIKARRILGAICDSHFKGWYLKTVCRGVGWAYLREEAKKRVSARE